MIRRQVVMPVSPERLWEALTDPEQVAGWFGGRVDWDLREGGSARFHGDDGTERVGRVEAVRPGRHLRFRWWTGGTGGTGGPGNAPEGLPGGTGWQGASEPTGMADGAEVCEEAGMAEGTGMAEVSEVSYLLEPVGEGTRLTIQERQVSSSGAAGLRACASEWTSWDGRLVGAWAGLVPAPTLASARA